MSLQLFVWVGQGQVKDNRIHYRSFTLNEETYRVGDCVYLYPEDETYPPYIARILSAFVDQDVQNGADPHCIEVKWFERRVNLEPSTKGIEESEREVFELEDTDVNPIGCIAGKCRIIKAHNYEEAFSQGGTVPGWFFCRGYFQQSTNSFVAYTPAEMISRDVPLAEAGLHGHHHVGATPGAADGAGAALQGAAGVPSARQAAGLGQGLDPPAGSRGARPGGPLAAGGAAYANANGGGGGGGDLLVGGGLGLGLGGDEGLEAPPSQPRSGRQAGGSGGAAAREAPLAAQQPASKRQKATGRTCMECGATSTPQWREGPMGPKTLCNACGVRYVRSQQKAAGQKRSSGGQKNGQGRPQERTPPRAQQGERGTARGTNPKVSQNARPTSADDDVSEP